MYGIATTGSSNTSDDHNRMVLLDVTGVLNAKVRNTHYKIQVPYTRLSQTVQRICRAGGKINSVTMASFCGNDVAETAEQKQIVETVASETVEKIKITETCDRKPVVEELSSKAVEHNLAETVADETVVVEIVPQITPTGSKKITAKAKGMGQKQPKSTKRDRKPKSRQ